MEIHGMDELRLHFPPVYAYNKKNQCIRSVDSMSWEPKKTAVSALGLPRDVILGDVLVNLCGPRTGECGKLQEHPYIYRYPGKTSGEKL